jgi:DnaK suppressor protein
MGVAARTAGRRPALKRARRASVALALSRLEREHVALLLAICELEAPAEGDAADGNAQALRAALLPMLREDLRQTQHALARAARGQYGVCEVCHKAIAGRTLELRPAATRCGVCEGRTGRRAAVRVRD